MFTNIVTFDSNEDKGKFKEAFMPGGVLDFSRITAGPEGGMSAQEWAECAMEAWGVTSNAVETRWDSDSLIFETTGGDAEYIMDMAAAQLGITLDVETEGLYEYADAEFREDEDNE